mmetsp:Transcript_7577/g.9383  ORF Transcript_7577/g.9383 Transcript_7577/m.9383 type:complete len:81 (-) Transcript_7577:284-526(-)
MRLSHLPFSWMKRHRKIDLREDAPARKRRAQLSENGATVVSQDNVSQIVWKHRARVTWPVSASKIDGALSFSIDTLCLGF